MADALDFHGGIKTLPLQEMDWLKVSEQHLLEFTAGVVYKDDTRELTRAREMLAYYPNNVLRFLLMREWNTVGGEWFPIGRIGVRGDKLGLQIQAAKLVQRFMRIAFMVSRTYFPYNKWFGTQFKKLPIASEIEPVLLELLEEKSWQQVEEKIGKIAAILLDHQNSLGITKEAEKALSVLDEFNSGVRSLLEGTEQLRDGRWLWIRVLTTEDANDIKTLLSVKRRPRKAKA